MAGPTRVDFGVSKIMRGVATRVSKRADQIERVMPKAVGTVQRRMKAEAVREIAAQILNVPANVVRPAVHVQQRTSGGEQVISVSASRTRFPLDYFKPRYTSQGVRVTTWRQIAPKHYKHAFERGSEGQAGAWQRIPAGGGKLVPRTPIVRRLGPSVHRVFINSGRFKGHGDIVPHLQNFASTTMTTEIIRLLKAGV